MNSTKHTELFHFEAGPIKQETRMPSEFPYLHVDDARQQLALGVPLPAEALDFGGIFLSS